MIAHPHTGPAHGRRSSAAPTPGATVGPTDGVSLPAVCRLARGVVLVPGEAASTLLDLERDQVFGLDEVGTQFLTGALSAGPSAAAEAVAVEYGAPADVVRADCQRLLGELQARRLVVTRSTVRGRLVPGALRLWLLLTLAWGLVRLLGWAATVRLFRRFQGRPARRKEPARYASALTDLDFAVRGCAARHLLNAQCKERALVTWHLLGRAGFPARLVLGIRQYPFRGHAWVECGDSTLSDDRERCEASQTVVVYGGQP